MAVPTPVTLQAQADDSKAIIASIDSKAVSYNDLAQKIWLFAEVGYQETRSSALLQAQLRTAGFNVTGGVAEIPTAFVAVWGSGKPVIGIVGEFDALPGLSQAAAAERAPISDNAPGHGCGHHLLGTGSAAAAIAVKERMSGTRHGGTIKFLGAPAEEGGAGKVYMLRAGLFDDVDAVVTWHPYDQNFVNASSSLAVVSGKVRFHGIAAHASGAPERARSALDAVEAMDYMVNMMREHVPSDTRMHYAITNGGGTPNVVPAFAEAEHWVRHNDMRILDGIWDRLVNAGRGAALGTDTKMEVEVTGAVWNVLPNMYLSSLMQARLEQVGGFTYTPDERAFAETLRKSLDGPLPALDRSSQVFPARVGVGGGSTDLGDVSWRVPTVQVHTATWVPGTPPHTWQAVAAGGMSIGQKGMIVAAKTMALTAIDLLNEPAHIPKAHAEFEQARGNNYKYTSRLADRKPPLDYRKQ
ncbi:MAG: amidohydrolase [Acidobacteria bacterium]|nr:amidohydrolase [Acidobacteriota bacterium]